MEIAISASSVADSPLVDPALYETDYLRWIETNVAKLKARDYSRVDWAHLIEEFEDMGRSERRALESNLIVILLHLLKWQYQPNHRSGSWESTLIEHRRRVNRALTESPSLTPVLAALFKDAYGAAVQQAKAETGLPLTAFPGDCFYAIADVLDDGFLPD
jgi:hypothetical protein